MIKVGVIVAGGRGKRISNFVNPKVMLKVGSRTLIENHIQGFCEIFNVDIIILVINPENEELVEYAKSLATKYKNKLVVVEGVGVKKNATKYGIDLIQAYKKRRDGYLYIYVMGDHYIDYSHLKIFKAEISKRIDEFCVNTDEKMIIFIDTSPKCAKTKAQSKVLVKEGIILKHGKTVDEWNALETGLFVIKREILSKLETRLDSLGDFDTTNIINVIRNETGGLVVSFDIRGTCWFGVNTFSDWMYGINNYIRYRMTLKETTEICKEGKAGIFAHLFYKYIAAIITFIVLKINPKIQAENISLATYILAIPVAVIAFFNPILGVFLYLFLEILDSVDGTIARIKNTCNIGGGLLDSGAGVLRHTLIPIAIFLHYKLYVLALGISLLQAMKFRLRWHMAEAGAHVQGIIARMFEDKRSRIVYGLTGDVIVTLILFALILEYFGLMLFVAFVPFLYPSGILISPIKLTAYFFIFIYLVMGFLDVARLPKIALRTYKKALNKVKQNV